MPSGELLQYLRDGRQAPGIRVVEHDLGDPAGGVVPQQGAVDEGHAEAAAPEDGQPHRSAPPADRPSAR